MTSPTPHSQFNPSTGEAAHAALPGTEPVLASPVEASAVEVSPTGPAGSMEPPVPELGSTTTGPEGGQSAHSSKSKKTVVAVAVTGTLALGVAGVLLATGAKVSPMEQAMANCEGSKAVTYVSENIGGSKPSSTQPSSETAKEDVFADYLDGVLSIEDNGTTLIIDTHGQDDDPLGIGSFAAHCVYLNLGTPEWIQESVSTTRAMDGRQTAEWDNYKAQWNYHPDNGLGMIITETKGN